MTLYERVKGFFWTLVFGGQQQSVSGIESNNKPSNNDHDYISDTEYFDTNNDDLDDIYAHVDCSTIIDGLGIVGLAATAANLFFGAADASVQTHSAFNSRRNSPVRSERHQQHKQTGSRQASLLELIAMEAPQCLNGGVPATLCNGISAAVDLYLSNMTRERSQTPQPQAQPLLLVETSAATESVLPVLLNQYQSSKQFARDDSKLVPQKPLKRKHYQCSNEATATASMSANQHQHVNNTSTWSRLNTADDSATSSHHHHHTPATTMKSLSTMLNPKPVSHRHGHNKNRREKERQKLTRYIHDDLNEATKQLWSLDDNEEDAAGAGGAADEDMVDCAIVRSCLAIRNSVPDVLQLATDAALSIGCRLSQEDFPEIRPNKVTPTKTTTTSNSSSTTTTTTTSTTTVVYANNAAVHVESSTVVITVTAAPASPAQTQQSAISWEISVDELRTLSNRPTHAVANSKRRQANNYATTIGASAVPSTSVSSMQLLNQCPMKMLLGVRPRERQISECSDDFICFERDSSDGSICYDVADDESSEFETDDDDDEEDTDDDSDDDVDHVEEAEITDNDDDAKTKTKAVNIADDSDDDDESDSESESEANSTTHQFDSGFEEKKGNKVKKTIVVDINVLCR